VTRGHERVLGEDGDDLVVGILSLPERLTGPPRWLRCFRAPPLRPFRSVVVPAANDKQQLQPIVEQVLTNVDEPDGVIADSGYFSEANVQALERRGGRPIEAHIAVERDRHGRRRPVRRAGAFPRA
jgi:hypothetical protein